MSINRRPNLRTALLAGCAALAVGTAAQAQETREYSIGTQDLDSALRAFAMESGRDVVFAPELVRGKRTPGVRGALSDQAALERLLSESGLRFEQTPFGGFAIVQQGGSGPQSSGAGGDVDALIVTAQKREENIQDVPIAISAFSQEDLTRSQIAGGPDLMTQVPNMTFTKTNFSSYSIQIRGIGTQAISATTDPAVAVAFNNTPFIRNRFFEQEFYDLQRVEVLRGPQGTLYGRNATAGVVNILSAKPKFVYEAKASADVSNYGSTRLEGMINVPLVEDMVALRVAGAWTKRDGYSTNEITGNPIDGRDLWSTRVSMRFAPTDRIEANLIWEHFEEDDDRLRSGKQLCKTDEVTSVAGFPTTHLQGLPESGQSGILFAGVQATFSQGCTPSSLYSPDSFQTPNGLSLPYYVPLGAVFLPTALDDPYVSRTQSHDLRVIESTVDPQYRAKTDTVELQANFDLSDALSLTSETAWSSDFIFSTQDFNRFNTAPGAWATHNNSGAETRAFSDGVIDENGVFCDPQIGCADRLVAVDLSTAKSRHFSQEFRLASNYDGAFNFSLGANFLRYDTEDKYYVFVNSLSLIAAISPYGWDSGSHIYDGGDNSTCLLNGLQPPDTSKIQSVLQCTYMDTNPIGSLNDQGHNYFLSRNPYKLISYAIFGEAYYNVTDALKLTAGLRWTVDKKEAPRIPSWVLADSTAGYPVADVTEQEWREPTGRLTLDWKPDLSFTDETLLYASYAHGYKAGGANPPPTGPTQYCPTCGGESVGDAVVAKSLTHPRTFEPEFVNAFEIGAKNTMLDGRMTLNVGAFYYDYTGYQVSQIVNRSAVNLNFDAEVWGLELEADWRPLENLRLGFKGGYEQTRVGDGESAIDLMDRTAGNSDWVVVRPFPTFPSNCILPAWLFVGNSGAPGNPELVNLGSKGGGGPGGCEYAYVLDLDPVLRGLGSPPITHVAPIDYAAWNTDLSRYPGWPTGVPLGTTYPGWDPSTAPNHGEGFAKDLSGNELPNAPHFTATVTADYTLPLPNDWLMTLHTDLYYQSEAWTRIFNTEGYDKLKAYTNVNLAAIFTNEDAGWHVMAYVKNVFDRDSITGAFLFSDDTGLTTNVFLTEPRLYGLRITKDWNGGPWWTGASPNHPAGEPYPLTVEMGGMVQRQDAPYETIEPSFAGALSPTINTLPSAQNRDLDWGDGRDVKLTYRPAGTPWAVSAGLRYGKTNSDTARVRAEEASAEGCAFGGYYAYLCPIYETIDPEAVHFTQTNWSDVEVRSREAHQFIDFEVGRDVAMGDVGSSTVSVGLRYAQFESTTRLHIDTVPDWYIPDGWFYPKYDATHSRFEANIDAARKFEGVGPILGWEGSRALIGGNDTGQFQLDWSIAGGILFGKQKSSITGSEEERHYASNSFNLQQGRHLFPISEEPPVAIDIMRTKSVSAPLVDLSLGLSYEIRRIKIGAGYRWERYFDVLDAGFDEHKDADRTIDGPYVKIAVGFGG